MLAVYIRELKSYYQNVTGVIFMGVFLLLSGVFFVLNNLIPQSPDYNGVLGSITFLFGIAVPVLTMRLLSEEQRHKTDQLLITSPLSLTSMVLGKYLAAVSVFVLTLVVTFVYPLLISTVGDVHVPSVVGGYIGFFLLGSSYIAIGLFISSLTENQVIAFFVTIGVLLTILILDSIAQGLPADALSGAVFAGILVAGIGAFLYFSVRNWILTIAELVIGGGLIVLFYLLDSTSFDGFTIRVLQWFSLLQRYSDFSLGILGLSPVVYYLSFCAVFVFLTVRVVEKRRWQ